MSFHAVIPARYASTRLPGKPLRLIAGLPMIVRTALSVQRAEPLSVTVATDDERIVAAVQEHDIDVMLTDESHTSGSDRAFEVASRLGLKDDDIVVNVQGDEPLVPAAVLVQLAQGMQRDGAEAATLCEPIEEQAQIFDPSAVKVVRRTDGQALYFSRAPIPYARDAFASSPRAEVDLASYRRHIGIYGFRLATLRRFVALPPSELEQIESLEQMRLLEAGIGLHVYDACRPVPGGVDTPEDLARVNARLAES